LNTLQNNIQDKIPTGDMNDLSTDTKEKIDADNQYIEINKVIDTMLGSLSQKKLELSQQESIVNKNIVEQPTNTITIENSP
jgi:hypothetical protein